MDAVHETANIEVDQQPDRDVQDFHIAEHLGDMNRQDGLHGFAFDQHASIDQDVES